MIDITYLHLRYKIDELSKKERHQLLDQMIENQNDLYDSEVAMLDKELDKI